MALKSPGGKISTLAPTSSESPFKSWNVVAAAGIPNQNIHTPKMAAKAEDKDQSARHVDELGMNPFGQVHLEVCVSVIPAIF